MSEFTREKSLNRRFQSVKLDENDLARLGAMVSTLASRFGGSLQITIVSADGEETIRTGDPSFFVSQQMVPLIRSVSFAYYNYKAPVSCRVELSAYPSQRAEISVSGTELEIASGIYRELERELKSRQPYSDKLPRVFDSFLVYLFAALVVATAIYSVFDMILNFAAGRIGGFKGSDVHKGLQSVGWISVVAGAVIAPHSILDLLNRAFPTVEFSGRLSDPKPALAPD